MKPTRYGQIYALVTGGLSLGAGATTALACGLPVVAYALLGVAGVFLVAAMATCLHAEFGE